MKRFLRTIIPRWLLDGYHRFLAGCGAFWYGHPSRRLIVIGVTGTKGKSTTVNFIARILEGAGYSVGAVSTINFKIAGSEWSNTTKQTMPGRLRLQRLLNQMVRAGCQYAVIETSSEGILQHRHRGIDYDIAVFTNLTPEHIEAHGSLRRYRAAKGQLFRRLFGSYRKEFDGYRIPKVIVANLDDPEVGYFLGYMADQKWGYTIYPAKNRPNSRLNLLFTESIESLDDGVRFELGGQFITLPIVGSFNVSNALAAAAVARSQGISWSVIKQSLELITGLPGRMEEIKNKKSFRIFVDYAHEPASLTAALRAARNLRPRQLINVLGSQGGGRDQAKRPKLGAVAARLADYVIVTNEDPYDEDPQRIIDDVVRGALAEGKVLDKDCWSMLDRREALAKALALAGKGDIVLITGKGSETVMAVAKGKNIPWNDQAAVRELLG